MTEFDPYEHLLRNFSKHKFKSYVEEAILNLESHPESQLPEYGEVQKDDWEDLDFAYMNMPTRMGVLYWITSYNRWMFHLDHVEEGLIRSDMIWENARRRIIDSARRLVGDEAYLQDLRETLYDRIGHFVSDGEAYHNPVYGKAILYYLTNANLDPYTSNEKYSELEKLVSSELRSIFLGTAGEYGLDLDKADFGFGVGSPKTFLREETREKAVGIIQRIEARPDSVNLQIVEGQLTVTCSNKQLFYVYDHRQPKLILLDQVIDPNSYFVEEEIEEFEFLLNRPDIRESELQRFLEAYPKFLLGVDYDELRPQVSLVDESGRELRPDFFLRSVGEYLWDILDIKLPNVPLVVGRRNRERLSQCVHDGVSQLMNYARFFDNPRNRERVYRAIGIDCFKPRLTLVIGKRRNMNEQLWKQIVEQERPFVNIVGFDDILEKAKKLLLRFPEG